VIALNYRGYGTSEGEPSAEHLKSDGLALFDLVAARDDVDRTRIAVFGRSLGTAVATHVAAARPVARVVLVSPYDSLAAVGRTHYPFLPVSLLLRHAFAPARDAPRCRMPLLAIVAPSDAIIPAARSRALLDAWAGPKAWVEIRDADHNTLGASREFWDAVAPFLRKEPGNG
jgi:pimeloyl-ACP methyl ester carboxylesterase